MNIEKYLDFVLRRPYHVIAVLIIVTLVLGSGILKLGFDSSIDSMMPQKDHEYILNERVKKIYGNNGKFIIISASSSDVMTAPFLKKFNLLHLDIEEYMEFDRELQKNRFEKLMKIDSSGGVEARKLFTIFKNDPVFMRLLRRKCGNLFRDKNRFSESDLKKLKNEIIKTNDVKKEQIVDAILSPFTAEDIKGEDDALVTFSLIKKDDFNKRILPEDFAEIEDFRKRLLNNPAYANGLYVKNAVTGKITDLCMLIRLKDIPEYAAVVEEIRETAEYHSDLDIIVQGLPVINHEINSYMRDDLELFVPLILLVIVFIFYMNFRSMRAVVLATTTLLFADTWVLGLMGHLGFNLSVVGVSLPPLMVAVGSSYSIHILNQYFSELPKIKSFDKIAGLKASMSHISLTVFLAGMTTFIGFFMLVTNQVHSIRVWGLFSAVGVVFAVIISISLIPAVLVLLPLQNKDDSLNTNGILSFSPVDRITAFLSNLAVNHYRGVVTVTFFVVLAAVFFAFNVRVETSINAYFKEGDYILKSSKEIGKKYGGSYGLNILLNSGKPDGVKEPAFLKMVETFRSWLVRDDNRDLNIGRTDAFTDFIKTMNLAMHNNNRDYYSIPEKRIDIESYINIFSGEDDNDDGRIDAFEPYVDADFRTANIFARVWEKEGRVTGSKDLEHMIKRIDTYLSANLLPGVTYKTSGEPKIVVRLGTYVVQGQALSLFFSLFFVFIIVIILFRNWKAGLIALVPICFAVLLNFGFMGLFRIRLDVATAIIASLTIGIGIDDTIHFMNTFRHYRTKNRSVDETIELTVARTGKAIIYTSLALVFGFTVLLVSNFKPIIYSGLLICVTMFATTIGALLILPSIIKITGISLSEPDTVSLFRKALNIRKNIKSKRILEDNYD